MSSAQEKMAAALKSIVDYIENMKKLESPKTLPAAQHMLAMISVIASETLDETEKQEACMNGIMPQVYVDLDGVMFDFDAHYEACFGVRSSKENDDVDWRKVQAFPGFYRNMPLMADWRDLWGFVTILPRAPIILTGVPKALKDVAAAEKREAVAEKLGDVEVITCASADKFAVLKRTPGAVLIDDWERYKPKWIAAGGQWITHTSAKDSVRQLLEIIGGII